MNIDDLAHDIVRKRTAEIERLMIETVERHLGRVASCAEVVKNGKHIVFTELNTEHYLWGTTPLFTITNHKQGFGFDVEKHV